MRIIPEAVSCGAPGKDIRTDFHIYLAIYII
jgi:hypothetical protein